MNTIQELNELGITDKLAIYIIENYKKRIGQTSGDFKITDITYLGFEKKDIELTCIHCGAVTHKSFLGRRNKWSELQKICPCQKILKKTKRTCSE